MKLFNLDLHVSVIADIKNVLESMGHQVDNWSISGHCWVFNKTRDAVDIVNENTWQNLDSNMCDAFYDRYKDELSSYDAFISAYPPVFSLLYKKFNKPIIAVAATRYEAPFSGDNEKWNWLNQELVSMIDSGQLINVANNKYDKFYCEYYTNREWEHIPSSCDYTESSYRPIKNNCILSSKENYNIDQCTHIKSLGRHSWDQLYSHKAIVHIPYNASIMSIFEQYTANVPLFFPTIEFGKSLNGYLSELFFNLNTNTPPCLSDNQAIGLSDFYDEEWMPHLLFYNSFNEISKILLDTDLMEVSNNMKNFNIKRKSSIKEKWSSLLYRAALVA